MAAATDPHSSLTAGSQPPSSAAPCSHPPQAGDRSASADAAPMPSVPRSTVSGFPTPAIIPVDISGSLPDVDLAPVARPLDGFGQAVVMRPAMAPDVSWMGDLGQQLCYYVPRGSYAGGGQRRGNGRAYGHYGNQSNGYRPRRYGSGSSSGYRQSQFPVRPPRPIFPQPQIMYYNAFPMGAYPNMHTFVDYTMPIAYQAYQEHFTEYMTMLQEREDLMQKIRKQIEYYFSEKNLLNDSYLRMQMDEDGWVPISLIANFNKIKELQTTIQFIRETMETSNNVEVKGFKIRTRNDPRRWVYRPTQATELQRLGNLETAIRNMGLNEASSSESKSISA